MNRFLINNRLTLLTGIYVLVMLPYLINLFINKYVPNWDESIQLNAAQRLANGEGYNSLILTPDVSDISYRYLALWPVGYSFLISLFLKMGLSLELGAAILKTIFVLIGAYGWSCLAFVKLKRLPIQLLFLAIIIKFQLTYLIFYTTDFFVFSLFPFIISNILRDNHPLKNIFITSILISLMIFLKYTSLSIVFTCCIYFLFLYRNNFTILIKKTFYICLIPTITYLTIFLLNKVNALRGTEVTSEIPELSLIKNPIHLVDCLSQFFSFYTTNTIPGSSLLVSKFGLPLPLIALCTLILLIPIYKYRNQESILKFFLVSLLGVFIFFLGLSVFVAQTIGGKPWWPIIEIRYYSYIFPLFPLCLLIFFESNISIRSILSKATPIVITILCIYFIVKNYKSEFIYVNKFNKAREIILADIQSLTKDRPSSDKTIIISHNYYPNIEMNYQYNTHVVSPSDLSLLLKEIKFKYPFRIILAYAQSEIDQQIAFKDFINSNSFEHKKEMDINIYWKDYSPLAAEEK